MQKVKAEEEEGEKQKLKWNKMMITRCQATLRSRFYSTRLEQGHDLAHERKGGPKKCDR